MARFKVALVWALLGGSLALANPPRPLPTADAYLYLPDEVPGDQRMWTLMVLRLDPAREGCRITAHTMGRDLNYQGLTVVLYPRSSDTYGAPNGQIIHVSFVSPTDGETVAKIVLLYNGLLANLEYRIKMVDGKAEDAALVMVRNGALLSRYFTLQPMELPGLPGGQVYRVTSVQAGTATESKDKVETKTQ